MVREEVEANFLSLFELGEKVKKGLDYMKNKEKMMVETRAERTVAVCWILEGEEYCELGGSEIKEECLLKSKFCMGNGALLP